MNANDKNIGIGLSVLGGAGLLWVFTRVTSLEGQLHSWSPPFESYEVTTIIVGLVALLCLAVGIRKMTAKPAGDAPTAAPQSQTAPSGGLDFRTLSKFIMVLGVAVACYGGYRVSQNMPLPEPPPSESRWSLPGWENLGVKLTNSDRARARKEAYKIMGVGGVILFVGLAINRSVKRPQ